MSNNVMNTIKMDIIPTCIFYKDILGKTNIDVKIKEEILSSKIVKEITDQQFEDGSWDRFHTLCSSSKTNITTENAIRRLLILGLDADDEPIQKAFLYMEKYLKNEIDYRDGKEAFSDWREITELFTAAWMLEIDGQSKIAGTVADKWANLITRCFTGKTFNLINYSNAFLEIFLVQAGKRVWNIESFHIVAALQNRLTPEIEDKFVDYILNNDKGIYYITSKRKLVDLPESFMSRETSRFLFAHMLLSRYSSYKNKSSFVKEWLLENKGQDGFWDLGPKVKDGVFFPYSESWRNPLNRKIDSTLYIQRYLHNIGEL